MYYTADSSSSFFKNDVPFNAAICSTPGTSKNLLTRGSRDEASEHFLCGSAPPDEGRYTGFYKGVPEVRYNDAG